MPAAITPFPLRAAVYWGCAAGVVRGYVWGGAGGCGGVQGGGGRAVGCGGCGGVCQVAPEFAQGRW